MKCKKLFMNCDGVLSCIAPFAEDISREKCFEGKGQCEFRPVTKIQTKESEEDYQIRIAQEEMEDRLDNNGFAWLE